MRWPDASPDTDYRLWERRGGQYVEGSQRDDAFALRFTMQGEFDRSMLSGKSYVVDVWFWTAGRSNRAGLAEDMMHRISTRPIEHAAFQIAVFNRGSDENKSVSEPLVLDLGALR